MTHRMWSVAAKARAASSNRWAVCRSNSPTSVIRAELMSTFTARRVAPVATDWNKYRRDEDRTATPPDTCLTGACTGQLNRDRSCRAGLRARPVVWLPASRTDYRESWPRDYPHASLALLPSCELDLVFGHHAILRWGRRVPSATQGEVITSYPTPMPEPTYVHHSLPNGNTDH